MGMGLYATFGPFMVSGKELACTGFHLPYGHLRANLPLHGGDMPGQGERG